MRTKQAVAAAAVLLALTATSCGDGGSPSDSQSSQAATGKNGGQAGSGADGDGNTGADGGVESTLAKVADADELIQLISNVTTCEYESTEPEDTVFGDIDGPSSESAAAEMAKTNKAWGIKERATCDGIDGAASNGHALVVISDMARFQAAFKDRQEADLAAGEGDVRTRWFIGQNFAARIYGTDSDERDMLSLGVLGLNCAPNYVTQPNSTTQNALVGGCILTTFVDA
ncbi:hypothetical protein ACFVZA_38245 [Streptomyces bottropensis]|uniref:hypothetical protein n=1 Tax=Streptomyces bottropensis TaxID=42235 RepID=UPI0036BD2F17